VAQCPSERPFYNDTRIPGSEVLTMPQLCVSVCAALNDPKKLSVSAEVPFRCSTAARIQADASTSSNKTSESTIVAAALGGTALLIVLIAVVIMLRSSGKGESATIHPAQANESPYGANAGQLRSNAMYVPSPANAARVHDPYQFDLDAQYSEPVHRSADGSFTAARHDDSYLDVNPGNSFDAMRQGLGSSSSTDPYAMGDGALFGADQNEFDYALNAHMQSTRM
jgi:hypothetical protein